MRFLLLMTEPDHFELWDASDDEHKERVFADFRAFGAAVRACGQLVAALLPREFSVEVRFCPDVGATPR